MTNSYTFGLDSPLRLNHNRRVTITSQSENDAYNDMKARYPDYHHDLLLVNGQDYNAHLTRYNIIPIED